MQHVDASGNLLWPDSGIAICTAPKKQADYMLYSANNGYGVAAWNDFRSSTSTVYAQMWNSNGNMLWGTNGKAISSAGANIQGIVGDGSGGVIFITLPAGVGLTGTRLDASGNVLWSNLVCTASPPKHSWSSIDSDGSGGFVIGWQDARYDMGDIYAQRMDKDGNRLWNTLGVALCQWNGQQRYVSACYDGNGGIIGAWEDQRYGSNLRDIYAMKVNEPIVPIELLTFNATQIYNSVRLDWITTSELNNSGFFIERKTSKEWESLSFMKGYGNSHSNHSYQYIDNDVSSIVGFPITIYYRLEQVDYDGTITYLPEIQVNYSNFPKQLTLKQNYPNPFGKSSFSNTNTTNISFYINAPALQHVTIKMYDVLGREIKILANGIYESGLHQITFNGEEINSGQYFIRMNAQNNGTIESKVIKAIYIK